MAAVDIVTRDGVRWITINRPDRRNALDAESVSAVGDAVRSAGHDPSVRSIVITGSGGAFSAGADLKAPAVTEGNQDLLETAFHPAIRAIRHAHKPVIAAVDGVAAGYGCSLALACDIRLASERARLSLIFVKVGLTLDGGGSWLLPRLVGLRALELAMTGDLVEAAEAERIGLVNRVLPVDGFDESVQEYAARFAKLPPLALAKIKLSIQEAMSTTLDDMLERERYYQQELIRSEDFSEGVRAFQEKRPPAYKGR